MMFLIAVLLATVYTLHDAVDRHRTAVALLLLEQRRREHGAW